MSPTYFPKAGPQFDASLPSIGSTRVVFPNFVGTIKTLRLPAVRPASLRCLRSAVPREHAAVFVSPDVIACRTSGREFRLSLSPNAIFSDMETTGSLKLPGDLHCLFAHVPGLRRVEMALANNAPLARPPLPARRRRPQLVVFRSSIAWLQDSLSTLRSIGYPIPRKTRF